MIKKTTVTLLAIILFTVPLDLIAQDEHSEKEDGQSFLEYRLASWGNWIFRSFLKDESDDATTWGHEIVSVLGIGSFEIKNIAYFEIAEYPRSIPGQPPGNPSPGVKPASAYRPWNWSADTNSI
jgi:hypothetical protein